MQTSVEQAGPKQLELQTPPIAVFKLIVVGDSGIGKSTFIKRFSTEIIEELVINDQNITVYKTRFATSIGVIQFNVWDLNGASVDIDSPEEFFIGADCAILMFDTMNRTSYKNLLFWFKKIQSFHESQRIPTVLVANKVDCEGRKVKAKYIIFHRRKNIAYSEVSAEANYNVEEPFLYLARALTKDKELSLVELSVLQPPSIMMDQRQIENIEIQRREADQTPFMEEDDDD